MNINRNKILDFVGIMASYIAIAALVLVNLHERSLHWKLFTDHYVSFSMLRFILFAAFAATSGILYARRTLFISWLKTNTFRYALLIIAVAAGFYYKFNALEFLILIYAVYAILFIKRSLDENRLHQSIQKLAHEDRRTRPIISVRSNFLHFITNIMIPYLAGLIVFFALIYAAKYMYWEKAFIQAYTQIFDFKDLKTASPYAEEMRKLPFVLLPADLIEVEVLPGAPLTKAAMAYFILYQTPHVQETLVFQNRVATDSASAHIANIVTHRMKKPTLIWRNWFGSTALPATRIILTVWRPKKAFTQAYAQIFAFKDLKTASPYAEEMRELPFGLLPGDLIEVEVLPGAPLTRAAMAYFILYQAPHVQETLVFQNRVATDSDSAHIANIVRYRMEKPTLIWRNWRGNAVLPATRIILKVWRPTAGM